jgi:putative phosphoribosyl transferase
MRMVMGTSAEERAVVVRVGSVALPGDLGIPAGAAGIVIFAHGSGSSRLSPRNRFVAEVLRTGGIGTLLLDLLTEREDQDYSRRFDIALLTERLIGATRWLKEQPEAWQEQAPAERRERGIAIGYFGASTGSAAALFAAAEAGAEIRAIVSRGGRPDLAAAALPRVKAPTLLIVGGADYGVIELNREAYEKLPGIRDLAIVPGATHLFEEPGALEEVARLARDWFQKHLV